MGNRIVSRAQKTRSRRDGAGAFDGGRASGAPRSAASETSSENLGETTGAPTPRNRGVGMLIITAYGIFAVSSFARALYQILTDFETSPVAYLLSGFAAAVYIVATLALARIGARAWLVALVAVLVELSGVLGVGLWTYLDPELFEEATVWSHFGEGYGFIPLLLPFIGLFWLLRHRPGPAARGVES
ncbi:hypothetical protein [Nesterenkonia lutea]|uniref:Integral membrane protein n=1 Tax=Nesterenkonia lutea TaxID=272919 RepID=A0ABR9JER2_9MICC|nr:hypothetical protein [Nesterenkonia lutea]MBE1524421.1 hypothetical protein [Nesterenkonia lutea]